MKVERALTSRIVVDCHCHVLQLASVQAANATPVIKDVFTTLMMLSKFLYYSSNHAGSLN